VVVLKFFSSFLVLANLEEIQLISNKTEKSWAWMQRVIMNRVEPWSDDADSEIIEAATNIAESTPVTNDVIKQRFLLKATAFLELALWTRIAAITTSTEEKAIEPQCYRAEALSVEVTSIPV